MYGSPSGEGSQGTAGGDRGRGGCGLVDLGGLTLADTPNHPWKSLSNSLAQMQSLCAILPRQYPNARCGPTDAGSPCNFNCTVCPSNAIEPQLGVLFFLGGGWAGTLTS